MQRRSGCALVSMSAAPGTFFDALVVLGLLQRDKAGLYTNSREAARFLDRASPNYIGGIIEMFNARLYGFWASLTEALRNAEPQNEAKSERNAQSLASQGTLRLDWGGASEGSGRSRARLEGRCRVRKRIRDPARNPLDGTNDAECTSARMASYSGPVAPCTTDALDFIVPRNATATSARCDPNAAPGRKRAEKVPGAALMDTNAQPERLCIQGSARQCVEDAKLNRTHECLRSPETHRGLHDPIVSELLVHRAPPSGTAVAILE